MDDEPQSSDGPERPRRPLWRRLLKWAILGALAAVLLLFLLVLALPVITNTGIVRRRVAGGLSAFLNDAHVGLDTLRVSPAGRRLVLLEGLSIAPAGQPDSPVVRVGTVRCTWSRSAILGGRVLLPSVSADQIRVDVRRRDGAWNFQDIMPVSDEPLRLEDLVLPLPLDAESIELNDVSISVSDGQMLQAELSGISADGSAALHGNLLGQMAFELTVAETAARVATMEAAVAEPVRAFLGLWREGELVLCTAGAWMEGAVLRAKGLGQIGPLSGSAGLGAELDLASLAIPRADGWAALPGIMADRVSLSLTGGPEYRLQGENRFWLNPAALFATVQSQRLPEAELGGGLAAQTTISGRLQPAGPEVALNFAQTVAGWDLAARTALRQKGMEADLGDADFLMHHWGGARLGDALFGMTALAGGGRLGRAELGIGGAEGSVADAHGSLALEASLPLADVLSLSADFSAARLAAEAPFLSPFEMPARAALRLTAREPSRLDRARVRLHELSGALGALVPAFRMEADADLGTRGVTAGGSAALDVMEASGLPADGVPVVQEVAGALGGRFALAGRLGEGFALEAAGSVDLPQTQFAHAAAEASLAGLGAHAGLAARLDSAFFPYEVAAQGRLALSELGARLAGGPAGHDVSVSSSGLDVAGELRFPGAQPAQVTGTMTASARGVGGALESAEGDGMAFEPVAMEAEARLAATPLAGDLELTDVRLKAGDLLMVRAPGLALRGLAADGVEGRFSLELPDLGALPAPLRDMLPEVAGRVRAEGELSGRVPIVDTLLAVAAGGEMPLLELFPLSTFYAENAPLDGRARLTVDGLSVRHPLSGSLTVGIHEGELTSEVALDDGDVTAALEARVPEVEFPALPLPLRDFVFSSRAHLREFDRFELEEFLFSGPSELLEAKASGGIAGLGGLRGVPTPAFVLEELDATLRAEGAVQPGGLPMPEGWAARGGMGGRAEMDLEGGRRLAVRMLPQLDGLAVRLGDLAAVSGLAGTFGLEKSWSIRTAQAEPPAFSQGLVAAQPPSPAAGMGGLVPDFGTAAGALSDTDAGLALDSASALGQRLVEAVRAELIGRGSSLLVPQFSLKPLGGTMVGRLAFAPAEGGRELRLDGEFGDIDFSAMLPPELRDFSGDSTVSGGFSLRATLSEAPGTQYNPIKDISGRLDVTRIGADALGRALLALDPAGERPSLVRLRSALRLAGPRRVEVRLERGFVSARVDLQGAVAGLVSSYSLPRFNIAQLLSSDLVRRGFGRAAMLGRVLQALDADVLKIGPDGGVQLVRAGEGG